MSGWSGYLFSVISCCLGCGIVLQIISDTGAKNLFRMICTLVILLKLVSPLTEIDWKSAIQLPQTAWNQGEQYVAEGQRAAREATSVRIEEVCRTYILEKAMSLGCDVGQVRIILNEESLPASAEIRGRGADAAREQLQEILRKDLGIPKEQQTWIWNQENSWPVS